MEQTDQQLKPDQKKSFFRFVSFGQVLLHTGKPNLSEHVYQGSWVVAMTAL